jgi:hypothetical protein
MDAAHKNILAIKQHSEETRKLFRAVEAKTNTIDMLALKIEQLEKQVQALQVKLFSGGATE